LSINASAFARPVPGQSFRREQGASLALASFPDVVLFTPKRHHDARGFFSETFSLRNLSALEISDPWVQDNYSLSLEKGIVRGLHLQRPPTAQAKLVRVNRGAIFDVILDMRPNSATFGRHAWVELSARDWNQLYIPEGYAHGFCTLEPDTEVMYKASRYYSPADEVGVLWNDPALGIPWPIDADAALLSPKDACNMPFAEIQPIDWSV
jgi:dTDP-4-dehydrorhamnose 3,5-epimerase